MGLFSSSLIDPDVADWQFEWFEWLIDNYSSGPGLPDSQLWLPISEHYSPAGHSGLSLEGRDLARFLFKRVGEQCGFGSVHPIKLNEKESPQGGFLGGGAILQTEGGACGLYVTEPEENGIKESIYYDISMTGYPNRLIATFAHEYAHALHNRSRDPLEIEPELYELFTDLTAIYLGFGIFLINTRFEYKVDDIGWSTRAAGYLPPEDMIFATALFMSIKQISMQKALSHLKVQLRPSLKKAFKQLRGYDEDIMALRTRNPTKK